MRLDVASKGRRDVFIYYLSNNYGISLLLDDCAYVVQVICHRQIQIHFFLVNAKEWNVDWCHRKSDDQWLVSYNSARVCKCLHAVITPRESIELPQENKYRRTFNTAHSHNLFTAVTIFCTIYSFTQWYRSFPRNFAGFVFRKSHITYE